MSNPTDEQDTAAPCDCERCAARKVFVRDGWHQVITGIPASLTTVAYRYESGGWWIPDPDFNEASLVGAHVTPLYTQAEVDELIERAVRKSLTEPRGTES